MTKQPKRGRPKLASSDWVYPLHNVLDEEGALVFPESVHERLQTSNMPLTQWQDREDHWFGPAYWYAAQHKGRSTRTVRLLHELLYRNGEKLPRKVVVKKQCGAIDCINPSHYEVPEELSDNTCRRGHDLTVESNVYITPSTGQKHCRVCIAERNRERVRRHEYFNPITGEREKLLVPELLSRLEELQRAYIELAGKMEASAAVMRAFPGEEEEEEEEDGFYTPANAADLFPEKGGTR